ncbi:hypothetical protein HBI56_190200 [Parastagonospora nodorum]|uniref:Uncharacterized protein n=1 Tax=Phaeosphaeria nodorum (strain SN15 / ATCC MYA-4574 / FGSC 10173) TaxID=321614 RepID=A0A7U2FEB5_PHANO|nr:hypothetical protein HBH56_144250 [Parastagonospora nodorum]QRD01420.1 hypothetical protein JI435_416600 [Parastagonospora nodorum SN15]KAH3927513.1 hypothetical protein HBH54_149440 [Parastagonospora nodorum]KAH3948034.1 hypothetical protein HBH53_109480 [Parastagonospora nodorum]KAH3960222.1 hypothetical protein HBH51_193300 [Parastagonospora nodorum]
MRGAEYVLRKTYGCLTGKQLIGIMRAEGMRPVATHVLRRCAWDLPTFNLSSSLLSVFDIIAVPMSLVNILRRLSLLLLQFIQRIIPFK